MAIILFDDNHRQGLYPLSATRSTADLRIGILTIKEKWGYYTNQNIFISTAKHLSTMYEPIPLGLHHWVDARLLVNDSLAKTILSLKKGECILNGSMFAAGCYDGLLNEKEQWLTNDEGKKIRDTDIWDKKYEFETECNQTEISNNNWILRPWNIFELGAKAIEDDYKIITSNKESAPIPPNCYLIGEKRIFIEEGASISPATIFNCTSGPIYIGKSATIMEGCCIRGPFSLGENSTLKMGSKIYGGTSIGPNCVVGGEIKNSSIQAYSNKAHDGYLGDSVVGQWCNLGAGTTNSNVKNTAGKVKVYCYETGDYVSVGLKCGCIIGDYSRTAIQTAINTGSIIGICCNVFGKGFPAKYLPHFSWGMGMDTYQFEKAIIDIGNWMGLKGKKMSPDEYEALKHLFENKSGENMIIV